MPVRVEQAIVPRRLQLSSRAVVFCCVCFVATSFGASTITISLSLILNSHAGSPAYWSMAALLLTLWFATLINMYRLTVAAILLGR